MELEAAKMIGSGLAAIALAGAGVGIGIIFGNYLSGAMRNPSAAQKQFPNLLLAIKSSYSLILSSLSFFCFSAISTFSKIWDFLNSRLLLILGKINFDNIINKVPNVKINQNIWEIQNSGFNWGIPPLSALYNFENSKVFKIKE